jgi:site-specific DNA-methyltransferase (adenine-specific)
VDERMKIEKISISEIKPFEHNAKIHTPEQIEQIKKSIQEFGNNDPIAIDENGVIIEGHGRFEAFNQLGFKEIEVIKLLHLSEEQKRAYTLIHNQLTMSTGFDLEILQSELDSIIGLNMENFGFELVLENEEETAVEKENEEYELMKFLFTTKQADLIREAIGRVKKPKETFGNTNSHGNAIYEVVKEWAERKKLF